MTTVYSYETNYVADAATRIRPTLTLAMHRLNNVISKIGSKEQINMDSTLAIRATRNLSFFKTEAAANNNPSRRKDQEKKVLNSA